MATFDERAKDWDTRERIARAADAADAIRANVAMTGIVPHWVRSTPAGLGRPGKPDQVAADGSEGVDEGMGDDDTVRPGPAIARV